MATLTLAGVEYVIAPYKLGALRKVAPILDKIKDRGAEASASNAAEGMTEIVEVLAVGLQKLDPKLTADYISDELVGVEDFPALRIAFFALMRESGMSSEPGEQKAPVLADPGVEQ
jgi:hypothetical protein